MTQPELIDLHHQGHERTVACYLLDTDDGPALFDCGPATTIDALKSGLDAARPEAHGRAPSPAQPHPSRPRGCGGRARARAPAAPGARLRDRRAAPRRPGAPRAQRAPALRRHVRHALGRARAGAAGERARRRRPRARPRLLPDAGPRVAPRLAISTATARSTPATRPASASSRAAPCCRRRRRRSSTSSAGSGRSRSSSGAIPERLALIHFGVADDPQRHLAELRLELYDWADFVRGGASEDEFVEYVRAELARRRRAPRGLGHGDAALAVLPRPRSAGPTCRRPPRAHDPVVEALRDRNFRLLFAGRGDLLRRDVSRADRGRLRGARSRRQRNRGRPELRRLDGRAGGDARVRRRHRRPVPAPRS